MMTDSSASTDQLVEQCQGMVRFLANQVRSRTPSWVDTDDLVGYGQVGLVQAARDFNPDRGVKFSTFAFYRIRGAIFDGISKLMWFKTVRDPEVKYNQLSDDYLETTSEETAQRPPAESGLAQEAGWLSRSAGALAMVYLTTEDANAQTKEIADANAPPPWSNLEQQETHAKLAAAIDKLSEESAGLIRMMYYGECTLQEAANRLNISKSWASRMHARALEQMSRTLRDGE